MFVCLQSITVVNNHLHSRIPHLGSEIQFIDDVVDSHVHVGEQGHMFTTLKVEHSPFAIATVKMLFKYIKLLMKLAVFLSKPGVVKNFKS